MVKAQVLVGGRGKAGGIKPADSLDEARSVAGQILGMGIHGYRVKAVYLEERLDIGRELYLGLTIDRSAREPLLMASAKGGIDIEAVPRDQIYMEHIPAVVGIQPYVLRSLVKQLALPKEIGDQFASVVRNAYDLFRKEDPELVEINPLVVTKDGRVVAGDAKLVIDDNAEYRHPEYANLDQDRTPLEQEAHDKGITFIQLDGDIGVIANGAGLTMATLDILSLKGGKGGTFLDLGGTDDPAKVKQAFELLIKANPSVILLNIFGAITKADTVALGVKQALEEMHTKNPVVARIKGVNEAQAKEMLRSIGMYPAETVEEAAELAVKVKSGGAWAGGPPHEKEPGPRPRDHGPSRAVPHASDDRLRHESGRRSHPGQVGDKGRGSPGLRQRPRGRPPEAGERLHHLRPGAVREGRCHRSDRRGTQARRHHHGASPIPRLPGRDTVRAQPRLHRHWTQLPRTRIARPGEAGNHAEPTLQGR